GPLFEPHGQHQALLAADDRELRDLAGDVGRDEAHDVTRVGNGRTVDRDDRVTADAQLQPLVGDRVRPRAQAGARAGRVALYLVDDRPVLRGVAELLRHRRGQVLRLDPDVRVGD